MYTTCVIWIAFVPIYFESESKIITMCLCISLSAMVTLLFLFLPKLYIILIRPEKNIRALFTTSKSIRCHIGSRVASAVSYKTSSSFSSCPGQQEDYDNELKSPPLKPINRTSSCQTSLELLYALLDLTDTKKQIDIDYSLRPSIGWSELNISNLTNYPLNNSKQNKSSPLKLKAYERSPPPNNNNTKSIISNKKNQLKRVSNGGSSKLTFNQTPNTPEETSQMYKSLPSSIAILDNNLIKNNTINNNQDDELIDNNICSCAPIFTIDTSSSLLSAATNNQLSSSIKTTISEESLSECSLSESCDCKLKSITIRLASPNLKI